MHGQVVNFEELGIFIRRGGTEEQRVPCPNCDRGPKDQALGVNVITGAFHCFRCQWKGRAGGPSTPAVFERRRLDDFRVAQKKSERLQRTWRQCVELGHPDARAVRTYFDSRALGEMLKTPPNDLRAHPGLDYWEKEQRLGVYPAMVAVLRAADNQPVTLHVTWLSSDGTSKASVPCPKKTLGVPKLGATKGGAIRLYTPDDGVLGVAEGIESALSLRLLRDIPVWSARCADNLQHIALPQDLRRLEVAVDVDPSGKGHDVAEALVARMRLRQPKTKCFLVTPDVDGTGDLNDELMKARHIGHS